jgi:hypothetical protein
LVFGQVNGNVPLVGLRSGRERAIELLANPPLVVGLLVNGLAYGAIFIVVAFLVSRFTPDIVGRSLLVIALFVAALVYVVFAIRAGESASRQGSMGQEATGRRIFVAH